MLGAQLKPSLFFLFRTQDRANSGKERRKTGLNRGALDAPSFPDSRQMEMAYKYVKTEWEENATKQKCMRLRNSINA